MEMESKGIRRGRDAKSGDNFPKSSPHLRTFCIWFIISSARTHT